MNSISVEEWQLLSFFEVEPQRFDTSVPWLYDDSVYHVNDGNVILSCTIHPTYKDIRLILIVQDKQVFEFSSIGIDDVVYCKERDQEFLKFVIGKENYIHLEVRPSIKITQFVKSD